MSTFLDADYNRQDLEPILFVEDNSDDFFIAQRELKRLNIGSPVARVDSIDKMLAYLGKRGERKDSEGPLPCVIVMDLSLRGEGGLVGLAKIRTSLKYRGIPVIAISSIDQFNHLKVAVQNGAHGHLFKPFSGDEFIKHAASLKLPLDFEVV